MSPFREFIDTYSMRNIAAGLGIFVLFAALSFVLVVREHRRVNGEERRDPSSFTEVVEVIDQAALDIENPRVFNPRTAARYINQIADRAYDLNSGDFIPKDETETSTFLARGDLLAKKMFAMRLRLNERLRSFEKSKMWSARDTSEAVDAFRRAQLYLRYAEDYVIDWRNHLSPLKSSATFFESEGSLSLVNPEFVTEAGAFDFKAGDVVLVRGASFLSATIARIGDVPSNMSHIAMIAETETGELRVVEALLEKSIVSYPLENYLKLEPLPRAAIYRFRDPKMAKLAGQELWKLFLEQTKNPTPFDIYMNPDEHSKIYCAEAMLIAYERASGGKVKIPRYRTNFSKAIKTDFAKGVGMTTPSSFAPADIDVDTRFDLVAEHRDLAMLSESRRFDVTLSKLFSKFQEGFTYKNDTGASLNATLGIIARKFGFKKDVIPEGIKYSELMTLIRHKNLVTSLMGELAVAEKTAVQQNGRPLSYRELETLFDKICADTCVERKAQEQYEKVSEIGKNFRLPAPLFPQSTAAHLAKGS